MYPLLRWNCVLVKRYKESFVYNLSRDEDAIITSSNFVYEVINEAAADILELCNGYRSISEIAKALVLKYETTIEDAEQIVNQFLIDSEKKQYIEFRNIQNKEAIKVLGNYKSYAPLHAELEITKKCPLRCKHCYNNSGLKRNDEMTSEEIIRVMEELKNAGVIKIAITGGEPTAKEGFADICKCAAKSFLAVAIMSNGYLINETLVNELCEYKDNLTFQISIDGNEEHHNYIRGLKDSFSKACKAIKLLTDKGFKVSISFTCNNINFGDMEYVTNLVKNLGALQITFGLTMEMGRAINSNIDNRVDIHVFYQNTMYLKRKYTATGFYVNVSEEVSQNEISTVKTNCGLGINQIAIRENGDVSPCICFFYSIGNLKKQRLTEILSTDFYDAIRNIPAPNMEICENCEENTSCTRCIADAYNKRSTYTDCKWRIKNKCELERLDELLVPYRKGE